MAKNLTWRELYQGLTEEEKDTDVTVYLSSQDEFFGVTGLKRTDDEADVLDANHPYLEVDAETREIVEIIR